MIENERRSHCCSVSRDAIGGGGHIEPVEVLGRKGIDGHTGMVRLEGTFLMGNSDRFQFPGDGEGPVRKVELEPFYIDEISVTNEQFDAFVKDTGYTTEAERFGWSFVFHLFVSEDVAKSVDQAVAAAPWWWRVDGADWKHPEGADSGIEGRVDHPVVHVSWTDAVAYSTWADKRLPTEMEWEFAARGGLEQKRFPWGDVLTPGGEHKCNVWQGKFPDENTLADGYIGTAPSQSFEPNGYGLYNTVGNVWEWCADWFRADHQVLRNQEGSVNTSDDTGRVIKGGSYLCHASYCNRYRPAARSWSTPDSATGHTGFRCARNG